MSLTDIGLPATTTPPLSIPKKPAPVRLERFRPRPGLLRDRRPPDDRSALLAVSGDRGAHGAVIHRGGWRVTGVPLPDGRGAGLRKVRPRARLFTDPGSVYGRAHVANGE
jgi:hypothetical protein